MLLTAVGIFAFVVVLAAFAVRYWLYGREISTYGFKEVFGFEPPSPKDGLDAIEEAQRKVDSKLNILAEVYADVDLHQRAMEAGAKKARSQLEISAYNVEIVFARQNVEQAKARFWRAHGLAKACGFRVHKNYTDYLPLRLRRKVLGLPQPQRGGHGSA